MAFTRDGSVVRCDQKAAAATAKDFGLRQSLGPEQGSRALRWEDAQTGGGALRLTWRDGFCLIDRHGGYTVNQTEDAWLWLTEIFGATPVETYMGLGADSMAWEWEADWQSRVRSCKAE